MSIRKRNPIQETDFHIFPLNDLKGHDTETRNCSCKPTIDGHLIIHNSFDGREFYEKEKKKDN